MKPVAMKILTRYIIREHLPPFFLALAVFVFLFLTNLIVKSIDKLLGKGLSLWILLEYIGLNLMWILALAIPMAVLVAILMSYGRMSADNEIQAMRASGISLISVIIPSLIFGTVVCLFLILFNNHVLPDFNHRARLLGAAIYKKKPDISIEPGYFIDDLPDFNMLVKHKHTDMLEDVLIYSKSRTEPQTTIMAEQGSLSVDGNEVRLTLYNGEIHELDKKDYAKYRKATFQKHVLTIPMTQMILERQQSGRRGDREMSARMMLTEVDSFRIELKSLRENIAQTVSNKIGLSVPTEHRSVLNRIAEMSPDSILTMRNDSTAANKASQRRLRQNIRIGQQTLETQLRKTDNLQRRIHQYMTEVHKKYSIPVACIVFVLIGAPLGVITRSGNWSAGAGFSLLFFLVYWVGLIGGEELADRLIISPFIAMWFPNLVVGILGIWLTIRAIRRQDALQLKMVRVYRRLRSALHSQESFLAELRGKYVQSKHSSILHHYSCSYARRILPKNKQRYHTIEEGLDHAERVCKRCQDSQRVPDYMDGTSRGADIQASVDKPKGTQGGNGDHRLPTEISRSKPSDGNRGYLDSKDVRVARRKEVQPESPGDIAD